VKVSHDVSLAGYRNIASLSLDIGHPETVSRVLRNAYRTASTDIAVPSAYASGETSAQRRATSPDDGEYEGCIMQQVAWTSGQAVERLSHL
jgi:hypothetical protein